MKLLDALQRVPKAQPMREHRLAGYEDTVRTLRHHEWLEPPDAHTGVTVHDLHREDPV